MKLRKNTRTVIGVTALVLLVIFVLQNTEVVGVEFLIWRIQASRIIIFLVIFLAGVVFGWIGKSLFRKL